MDLNGFGGGDQRKKTEGKVFFFHLAMAGLEG